LSTDNVQAGTNDVQAMVVDFGCEVPAALLARTV
jgi:hypothetical protein